LRLKLAGLPTGPAALHAPATAYGNGVYGTAGMDMVSQKRLRKRLRERIRKRQRNAGNQVSVTHDSGADNRMMLKIGMHVGCMKLNSSDIAKV